MDTKTYGTLNPKMTGNIPLGGITTTLGSANAAIEGSRHESPFEFNRGGLKHAESLTGTVTKVILVVTNVIVKSEIFVMKKVSQNYTCNRVVNLALAKKWRMAMERALGNIIKIAMVVAVSFSFAFGQGKPKLDIQISDQKINLAQAEKKDPQKITYAPGDTMKYTLVASNIGDGLMTKPEIVDPIPAGVTYIPESATGEDTEITFSLNQGNSYQAWPAYYTVRNAKGVVVRRKASPDMVTHIKWHILKNLKQGESMTLEFMVEVSK